MVPQAILDVNTRVYRRLVNPDGPAVFADKELVAVLLRTGTHTPILRKRFCFSVAFKQPLALWSA